MIERRAKTFSELRRQANKRRRFRGGYHDGPGAGAPNSMQEQRERDEATRRHIRQIITPAVQRIVAEQAMVVMPEESISSNEDTGEDAVDQGGEYA